VGSYTSRGRKVKPDTAAEHFEELMGRFGGIMVEPFYVGDDGTEQPITGPTPSAWAKLDPGLKRLGWSWGSSAHRVDWFEARVDDGDLLLIGPSDNEGERLTGVLISGILFDDDQAILKRGKRQLGEVGQAKAEAQVDEVMRG